ncbi:hypothetical protein Tco_0537217 [Tanacetum coccineum]
MPDCWKILFDHPLSYALTATSDVSAVYLQQFWQTVYKVPNTKDTIRFKLNTQEITYTMDMFRDTLNLPVETLENSFVASVNIEIIESFMNRMKKFPSIPPRIEEDYHSIKDDILLIRAINDFNEYEMVFVNVVIPMKQPQPVVSTQGTHRNTPRAHRTPTLTTVSPRGKKRKQSVGESNSPQKSLKITIRQKKVGEREKDEQSYDDVDDSDNRLEPKSHKENLEYVNDDDDKEEEKVDEKEGNEIDCDAFRSEVPGLLSQEFNTHAPKIIEELFKNYVQNNVIQVHSTTITSTKTTSSADLQQQKSSLQDQANDLTLWDVLKRKFEKSSTSKSSCRDDDFYSHGHDDH